MIDLKVEINPADENAVVWEWKILAKETTSQFWIVYKYGSEFGEDIAFRECNKEVSKILKEYGL